MADIAAAKADGSYRRLLRSLAKIQVLIIDDWGLAPLSADEARDILEVINDRSQTNSTVIASQLPVDRWYGTIGDPTVADAIMDRLVHISLSVVVSGTDEGRGRAISKETLHMSLQFRALSHRDFRWFWIGQIVSLFGSSMQMVAQSWLVLELTVSPFRLGLMAALQFGPILVLSLFAGVIIDHFPKRKLVIITQCTFMLLALVISFLVESGHVRYWHLALVAVVSGVVNSVDTPARQSYMIDLVGKEDLQNAIALGSLVLTTMGLLGPAIGGMLIVRFGIARSFLLNGISFIPLLVSLLLNNEPGLPLARARDNVFQCIREGLRYAIATQHIMVILLLLALVSPVANNFSILLPLLAKLVLHQQANGYGYLVAALGAGSLLGAIVLATWSNKGTVETVIGSALFLAITTLMLGSVSGYGWAIGILFVAGVALPLVYTTSNTVVQASASGALRGRIMSLFPLVTKGVIPLGALLIGGLAQRFGVRSAIWSCGAFEILAVMGLAIYWRKPQFLWK